MFGYFRNHIRTHFNDNKNTEFYKKEYVGHILNKKDLIFYNYTTNPPVPHIKFAI